jgi:sugar fermentation stimulation protein A
LILKNLNKGRFIRRYKRFFADIELELDGKLQTVVAHCPNTGSMKSLIDGDEELACYVSKSDNPKRKLAWTFEMLELPIVNDSKQSSNVLINTRFPNYIVAEWLASEDCLQVLAVESIISVKAEPRLGEGRSDFFVETSSGNIWIEVKNVTYGYEGVVSFPDSVSKRASRHLCELESRVLKGERGIVLFLVSREDAQSLSLSNGIDKVFEQTLAEVQVNGVEVLPLKLRFSENEISQNCFDISAEITGQLPIG